MIYQVDCTQHSLCFHIEVMPTHIRVIEYAEFFFLLLWNIFNFVNNFKSNELSMRCSDGINNLLYRCGFRMNRLRWVQTNLIHETRAIRLKLLNKCISVKAVFDFAVLARKFLQTVYLRTYCKRRTHSWDAKQIDPYVLSVNV